MVRKCPVTSCNFHLWYNIRINLQVVQMARACVVQCPTDFLQDYTVIQSCLQDSCTHNLLSVHEFGQYHAHWKCNYMYVFQVQSEAAMLLKHPLVCSLLAYKWKSYGRFFYLTNLLLYLVFLSFLTAYALVLPSPLLTVCE